MLCKLTLFMIFFLGHASPLSVTHSVWIRSGSRLTLFVFLFDQFPCSYNSIFIHRQISLKFFSLIFFGECQPHCRWHTQFELDPVCHQQQADTFLDRINLYCWWDTLPLSIYRRREYPWWQGDFSPHYVQTLGLHFFNNQTLGLHFQSLGRDHSVFHLQFSCYIFYIMFFFCIGACQPTVSDTLSLN